MNLLFRVEILESQLSTYGKSMGEDKLREETKKLMEDKEAYQLAAKLNIKKLGNHIFTIQQGAISFWSGSTIYNRVNLRNCENQINGRYVSDNLNQKLKWDRIKLEKNVKKNFITLLQSGVSDFSP